MMQNDVSGNRDGLWYLILFVILATPPPLKCNLGSLSTLKHQPKVEWYGCEWRPTDRFIP